MRFQDHHNTILEKLLPKVKKHLVSFHFNVSAKIVTRAFLLFSVVEHRAILCDGLMHLTDSSLISSLSMQTACDATFCKISI